jgi:5-methylcytosine-specific restriction endonuclease McrA
MNKITYYLVAKVSKSTKKKLYKKYKGCQKCGEGVFQSVSRYDNYLEIHHKIPKSEGGTDNISNLELLCRNCHDELHGE